MEVPQYETHSCDTRRANGDCAIEGNPRRVTRLGIDATFVRPGVVGGVEQGVYATARAVARASGSAHAVYVYSRERLANVERIAEVQQRIVPGRTGNRFISASLTLPGQLARDRVESILFPNYFTPPTLPGTRKATIINDLQYVHYPRNFSALKRAWLRFAHESTLRLADVTIAISDWVRDDILRVYGSRFADKVTTVPLPVDWSTFGSRESDDAVRPACEWPFLLSVAAQYPHKNLETLIRAFGLLRGKHPDLRLVLVGQVPERLVGFVHDGPNIGALITSLGLDDRVVTTGYVSDREVGWYYRHAVAFVFPSLFEGMGRPVVEALGLGLPTVTTRCGSLPEVSRGLAVHVANPTDPAELASVLDEIVRAPSACTPTAEASAVLRHAYSPDVVGPLYLKALTGD